MVIGGGADLQRLGLMLIGSMTFSREGWKKFARDGTLRTERAALVSSERTKRSATERAALRIEQ